VKKGPIQWKQVDGTAIKYFDYREGNGRVAEKGHLVSVLYIAKLTDPIENVNQKPVSSVSSPKNSLPMH
jgi:hypothetical protein